jgi:hypothetical protein
VAASAAAPRLRRAWGEAPAGASWEQRRLEWDRVRAAERAGAPTFARAPDFVGRGDAAERQRRAVEVVFIQMALQGGEGPPPAGVVGGGWVGANEQAQAGEQLLRSQEATASK